MKLLLSSCIATRCRNARAMISCNRTHRERTNLIIFWCVKKCNEVACLQQIRVLFCLVSCAARHILCHVASRGGVCHILGTASRITY